MKRRLHAETFHKDSRTLNDSTQPTDLEEQTAQGYQETPAGVWLDGVNTPESYESGADGIEGRVLRKMKRIKLDSE